MSQIASMAPSIMGTYRRFPLTLVKGQGSEVFDEKGRRYLDFLAGISVNALGHAHPVLVDALSQQANKLWHVSNLYNILPQEECADLLVENSGLDQVFFCNSGTEAIEASLKLSRVASQAIHGKERPVTIAMNHSFHGRTYGSLSVTGQEAYQKPFEPMLPDVRFVNFGDLNALESQLGDDVAAVLLEPLQAEGGLNVAPEGYLAGVRKLCDAHGILLIFDEVQVGVGRLGHLFAHQGYGVEPDIMALAKGLGGGFPIGAMMAKEHISKHFVPGTHASTFGGNPLGTAVSSALLKEVLKTGFLEEVRSRSAQLKAGLSRIVEELEGKAHLRGEGMLQGLGFEEPVGPLVSACMEAGLLVGPAGATVLRLAPPLNLSEEHLKEGLAILSKVLKETI
jgi:acetylornithine/N-succinyldiaminopimelate aminotransferase